MASATLGFFNFIYAIRRRIVCTLLLSFVPVCISPIFICTSKGSEIQRVSKFRKCQERKLVFKDIEMGPMVKGEVTKVKIEFAILSSLYRSRAKTETRCISEPFEVQTKVGEAQTDTKESFSNGISEIKKS